MKLFTKSFLLVLLLLIVAEGVVRVFWSRNMSGRFEYGYNPMSGFEEQKDGTVNLVRAGGRRFRPQSFKMPKPSGVFRAFVIGDSVPRGPSLEDAYAYRLEKMLKEKNAQAEIFNLGVAGYGARRSQIVLKQALKYQPDFVVMHLNNSNEYEDEREYRRAQEFKSWHPKNWLMKSLLLRRMYEYQTENIFWKLLPQKIRQQEGVSDADAEIVASQNEETLQLWQKRVEENALEDARILKNANVQGIFVIQAVARKDSQGTSFLDDEGLDVLGVLLEQEGAKVVYMKEIFSKEVNFKDFFSDGSHLRPSGHQEIAEAIQPLLLH